MKALLATIIVLATASSAMADFCLGATDTCDASTCDSVYRDLFYQGVCKTSAGLCPKVCLQKLQLWSTIFVFVVLVSAVVLLVFILPICFVNCTACLTARSTNKRSKRGPAGGPGDVNGMEVVSAKGQPMAYSPYAYWPYYGR